MMETELQGERIGIKNAEGPRLGDSIASAPLKTEAPPKTAGQGIMAWVMLAVGYCYIDWIFTRQLGLGALLFSALFCGAALIYMHRNGHRQTKESLFFLGAVGGAAVYFAVFDNAVMSFWNLQFLKCMAVYWICVTAGRRIGGDLSAYVLGDFINQIIVIPFGNFGRELASLFQSLRVKRTVTEEQKAERKGRAKNAFLVLGGLLLVLPLLLWIVDLLTSADAAFSQFIDSLHFDFNFTFPDQWGRYIVTFLLGIPVACYLYGLLYGNVSGRNSTVITKESFDSCAVNVRIIPKLMAMTALGAIVFVYLVFFATQAAYLFSAFRDHLPMAMTYAEYVRRGFFELCTVAGINLTVIALIGVFADREASGGGVAGGRLSLILRIEIAAVCGLTMMLIATAVSKMALYIHYYGLTQLRFYTTAFMTVIFVGFVVILIRQFNCFNCGRILVLICMAGFLLTCYSNADGLIARYNIGRYEEGTLDSVDVTALDSLSAAAVPAMCELYSRTEDSDLKMQLHVALQNAKLRYESKSDAGFREWNVQRAQAENSLKSVQWAAYTQEDIENSGIFFSESSYMD